MKSDDHQRNEGEIERSAPQLPLDAVPYRRTPTFDQDSLPQALRRRHRTREGVWGRIEVLAGRLRYRVLEPEVTEQILEPGRPGIVEPAVPHEVEPLGAVRFFVEFWRETGDPESGSER